MSGSLRLYSAPMARRNSVPTTERILNLLVLLTESPVPLTLDRIAHLMEGQYPDEHEGRRTAFERDKKVLREIGVPISVQTLAGGDAGRGAYSVDKTEYALIDFGLTDDEMAALQQAAATVQMGTKWGGRAVQWLGGEIVDAEGPAAARVIADDPRLPVLHSACSRRQVLGFDYRGRARRVHPYGLIARNGFWYLVGFDVDQSATKTFRVDRVDGDVVAGEAGAFERPDGFVLAEALERDSKLFDGGDEKVAVVRVDARLAPGVVRELGEESVRARLTDGSVEVLVPCGNFVSFRNWLFAMVDRAVVLSPRDVRDAIVDELAQIAKVSR